jgi:SAM-dependent methyltransferase
VMFTVNLITFFFAALYCHQTLAAERPQPGRLTEFFLLLSIGGVVGGAFNALVAPVIFNMVWEYPLVLILCGLIRPWRSAEITKRDLILLVAGVVACAAPPIALELVRYQADLRAQIGDGRLIQIGQLVLGVAAILAFLVRERGLLFTLILALAVTSSFRLARGYEWDLTERSFFGVMRVATINDARMGGDVHVLMHGTTLHGAQSVNPDNRCLPTLYYAPNTPLGQAAQRTLVDHPAARIGVVGQGSGAMAAYKRSDTTLTFFEIDPLVDRLSRNPRWFTYIDACADGPIRTVIGDARLTLAEEPAQSYDLLIIDAFSSDAVPTHLLTTEAIAGYLRLVKPDGVVLLHLSNRNLEITRPAVAAAEVLNAPSLHQIYIEAPDQPDMQEASTEALILSPTEAGLSAYRQDGRWRAIRSDGVRPWTDDYVDLFGAMVRQFQPR